MTLSEGVTAAVSSDDDRSYVFLWIADESAGAPFNIRIPAEQASDLAVALVNAANGM